MRLPLATILLCGTLVGQVRHEIVPSAEGLLSRVHASSFFITTAPVTAQSHFAARGLSPLRPGDLITGFEFRSATTGAATPASALAFSNFEVTMGTPTNAVNRLESVFANNFTTRKLVRSGPWEIPKGSLPPSGDTSPWGAFVEFDVPYVYPGGDLLLQITHTGTASQGLTLGVTTDPNYARSALASQFQALRANGNPVDGGPFLRFRIQPQGPYFSSKSVTNGASGRLGILSPGAISTLYGTDLGPSALAMGMLNAAGTAFEKEAGGTRVLVDGVATPVIYSSRGQVSFVAPYAVHGRDRATVAVEYGGQTSSTPVTVAPVDPALFTSNQSGRGQGAILNQDASVNSAENPAAPGTILVLFGTGAGQTSPGGVDGELVISNFLPRLLAQPTWVSIGGQDATVAYSGPAPGAIAGLWQINVHVPAGLPTNLATPLVVRIGDSTPLSGVTAAIRIP